MSCPLGGLSTMVQGKRRSRDTVGFLSERDKLNMSNKIYLKKNYVKRNLWISQDRTTRDALEDCG